MVRKKHLLELEERLAFLETAFLKKQSDLPAIFYPESVTVRLIAEGKYDAYVKHQYGYIKHPYGSYAPVKETPRVPAPLRDHSGGDMRMPPKVGTIVRYARNTEFHPSITLLRDKGAKKVAAMGLDVLDVHALTSRLNGQKRMLLGNHDHLSIEDYYLLGFEKVLAYREMAGILFSHVPVHPSQFYRFKGNVHGHTHDSLVREQDFHAGDGWGDPDPRYMNVCVEPRGYVPISLDEIVAHFEKVNG